MAEEFRNDPMMRELHEIRAKHSTKGKAVRDKGRGKRLEKEAEKFVALYGYKLVPTRRGTHKLVKAA